MATIKSFEDFLDRMQGLLDNAKKQGHIIVRIEDIETAFPELKESEDERIRKSLIGHLKECRNNTRSEVMLGEYAKWIAWLEKQGEQKPADKVEPKFHEGEWIIHHGTENIYQVTAIVDNQYQLKYGDNYTVQKCADVDRCARLWDIAKDAKDGDVLVNDAGCIFIYKNYMNDIVLRDHCHLSTSGYILTENDNEGGYIHITNVYPATKEQRDLLFQKMKEAGYEWDAEKNELKKIEQNPAEWSIFDYRTWQYIVSDVLTKKDGIGQYLDNGECKKIAKYMQEEWSKKLNIEQKHAELLKGKDYGIDGLYHAITILEETLGKVDGYQTDDGILEHKCAISAVKNLYEQKPAWSEEDESILFRTINDLKFLKDTVSIDPNYAINIIDMEHEINWLKSLKERVQPKQEWSEKEQQIIEDAASFILSCVNTAETKEEEEKLEDLADKLQDLRPQNKWKPSDEQIKAVKEAACYSSVFSKKTMDNLILLSKQLKKLREE